jgi:hypothetical protein
MLGTSSTNPTSLGRTRLTIITARTTRGASLRAKTLLPSPPQHPPPLRRNFTPRGQQGSSRNKLHRFNFPGRRSNSMTIHNCYYERVQFWIKRLEMYNKDIRKESVHVL